MTTYVSIGNSDDKLTQQEWCEFVGNVGELIQKYAAIVYGEWYSLPNSAYQNACWCAEFGSKSERLKRDLRKLASLYRQDSIAFATAKTEFIGGADE